MLVIVDNLQTIIKFVLHYLSIYVSICLCLSIYLSIYISIYLSLNSPFVGPWPIYQYHNRIHSRQDSSDGGSARRKAVTYTQSKRTKTSIVMSGIRIHDPSVRAGEDSSCLRLRSRCDRPILH
jgi:hypothetical protein